jgi:hypothetical protein
MKILRPVSAMFLLLGLASVTGCSSSSPDPSPTGPTPGPTTTVTPPAVQPALAAPVAVSPLSGTTVGARPSLTVTNAARTGTVNGAVSYTFELAENSAFNPVAVSVTAAEGSGQTTFAVGTDLGAGKTYFWRAVAVGATDGLTSPASEAQTITIVNPTQAERIAAQRGLVLWPGAQPTGTAGRANLGPGWGVGTQSSFDGVTFQTPPIDALRVFDLLDRGYDPDAAIGWMRVNGYGSVPVYYPEPKAIGFPYQYMALVNGAWELVRRVGA